MCDPGIKSGRVRGVKVELPSATNWLDFYFFVKAVSSMFTSMIRKKYVYRANMLITHLILSIVTYGKNIIFIIDYYYQNVTGKSPLLSDE